MADLNQRIIEAVQPVAGVCVPDLYLGEQETYCTFNFTELPAGLGDNGMSAVRYLVQVHLFLPLKAESAAIRRQLRAALLAADFSPPSITNATDEISQHYVYEFEDVGGLADG